MYELLRYLAPWIVSITVLGAGALCYARKPKGWGVIEMIFSIFLALGFDAFFVVYFQFIWTGDRRIATDLADSADMAGVAVILFGLVFFILESYIQGKEPAQ